MMFCNFVDSSNAPSFEGGFPEQSLLQMTLPLQENSEKNHQVAPEARCNAVSGLLPERGVCPQSPDGFALPL